jgi:hypothetical protein
MRTMVHTTWRGSLTVLIAVHGRSLPADAEWQLYFDEAARLFGPGADASRARILAITDGGAPSSRQREQLRAFLREREIWWTVITTSRFARGVTTALGWFFPRFKIYAPQDFARAAEFLGVPAAEVPSLLEAILDADHELHLDTVAEIATTLAQNGKLGT